MLQLAWRSVRHNTGRYVATLLAIITGVAFFTSTGFLSDRVIDALEGDVNRQFGSVDAAIVVDPDAEDNFAGDLRIGGDVVDQVAALPEVEAVGGDLAGSVAFLDEDGDTFADGATGRLWVTDDELNPIDIEEGAAPQSAGEIAVDQGIADDQGIEVGDRLTMLTLAGQVEVTVVGITSFGDSDAQDQGGTVSVPEASAFDLLNSGLVELEDLYIRGSVPQAELVDAVEPLTPPGFEVQSGEDFLADKRDEKGGFGRVLKTALQAFAGLALFVGAFVIYNTFNVIVAQRLRELAVLAAIGATPKQIKRSLRLEGLVIGVIGSALGVLAGLGLAFLLMAVLSALGVALPGSGIRVTPTVVVQGLLAGTVITFFSVTIPARRAAKTEPIEALRQSAVEGSSVTTKRIITTAVLIGLGVFGMITGSSGAVIGLCALLLIIGVIIAGPIIALIGSRVARPFLSRLGLEGRLAADNSARNPQRTATTANALLIGVFLVTLVTVAGTSAKDFAVAEINELSSADYLITSEGGTIDDQLVSDLEGIDDVEAVVPFRRESVTLDGEPSAVSTGDFAALTEAADIEFIEGSFDDLGPGSIAVLEGSSVEVGEGTREEFDHQVGSTVTLVDSAGDTAEFEVVALVESSIDTGLTGSFVDAETFDGFVGDTAPTAAFLTVRSGAQTDVEDAIDEITSLRPDIFVLEGNALGRLIGGIFEFLINAVNGLLLMSVIVALIGIVNTLSLSIIERRRELGLLRAVGMVDRRVQRMVRLESVLISALGTVTGVVLGLFVGWATIFAIDRLSEAGIGFSFPVWQLLIVLVLGVVLGFLASYIPSRRSTRLDVLDAIAAT